MSVTNEDFAEEYLETMILVSCRSCDYRIESDFPIGVIDRIKIHILQHHPFVNKCDECGLRFRSEESLDKMGVVLCSQQCIQKRMFPFG